MPPSPLSWHLNAYEAMVVMTLRGGLDVAASSLLYRAVVECLEQEPAALIMDLSGLTVVGDGAATVFATILHRASRWPGAPVLLCAPGPERAALPVPAAGEPPTVFDTVGDALVALIADRPPPPISEELLPAWGAARRARDLATEACLRWDLAHLVGRTALVANELVVNATNHAGTVMTLHLKLGRRYLYVAVFDGVRAEPALRQRGHGDPADGHGLLVVESLSEQWGCTPTTEGKVIWAALDKAPS